MNNITFKGHPFIGNCIRIKGKGIITSNGLECDNKYLTYALIDSSIYLFGEGDTEEKAKAAGCYHIESQHDVLSFLNNLIEEAKNKNTTTLPDAYQVKVVDGIFDALVAHGVNVSQCDRSNIHINQYILIVEGHVRGAIGYKPANTCPIVTFTPEVRYNIHVDKNKQRTLKGGDILLVDGVEHFFAIWTTDQRDILNQTRDAKSYVALFKISNGHIEFRGTIHGLLTIGNLKDAMKTNKSIEFKE